MSGLFSCQKQDTDAGFWQMENERVELEQKVKLAEYRLESTRSGGDAELSTITAAMESSSRKLRELRAQHAALSSNIRELEAGNGKVLRLALEKQRSEVIGRQFESLSLKDGRMLEKVSIASVDDGGVAVRHEHGVARLRCADLTPEQQILFGMDAATARDAEAREALAAAHYERHLDTEIEKVRQNDRERRDELAEVRERERERRQWLASNVTAQAKTSALAKPATPFGSGSIWSSRAWDGYNDYRGYRRSHRYVYYQQVPSPYACRLRSIDPIGREAVRPTP